MGEKFLFLSIIAVILSQGHCNTEIILEDVYYTYTSHVLLGKGFSIPKSFLDTLISCHVRFPNGIIYEGYPENRFPTDEVQFLDAAQPFTSCGIGFRGTGVEHSGTYELMSVVQYRVDDSFSLTRQKIHITIVMPDLSDDKVSSFSIS